MGFDDEDPVYQTTSSTTSTDNEDINIFIASEAFLA